MSLDTLDKMLNHLIINFIAEHGIVLNNQNKKNVIVINLWSTMGAGARTWLLCSTPQKQLSGPTDLEDGTDRLGLQLAVVHEEFQVFVEKDLEQEEVSETYLSLVW